MSKRKIFFILGILGFLFWQIPKFTGNLKSDIEKIQQISPLRVFRCVLNGYPRTLVIQLNSQIFAAYDTEKCFYRLIWKAKEPDKGVHFTGAVYNEEHGPQPQTLGSPLILNEKAEFSARGAKLRFLSYVDKGNKSPIIIRFELREKETEKRIALIESSLQIIQKKSQSYLKNTLNLVYLRKGSRVSISPSAFQWQFSSGKTPSNWEWKKRRKIELFTPLPIL